MRSRYARAGLVRLARMKRCLAERNQIHAVGECRSA
jgi:hypothetical protein